MYRYKIRTFNNLTMTKPKNYANNIATRRSWLQSFLVAIFIFVFSSALSIAENLHQDGDCESNCKTSNQRIEMLENAIHNYQDIYAKGGNRDQAITTLKKAVLIDPNNAIVRLSLADHYRAMNKPEDAFIELKIAFADPNLGIDEKVRIILSFFPLFADYKMRAYADELAAITAKIHPDDPKAFSVYGDVLYQEQKFPEAKEAYKKALVLNDQVYQIWEQVLRIDITESKYKGA